MNKGVASFIMEELGQDLMVPAPVRPARHVGDEHAGGSPEQGDEAAAHLRDADADQATPSAASFCTLSGQAGRRTDRKNSRYAKVPYHLRRRFSPERR